MISSSEAHLLIQQTLALTVKHRATETIPIEKAVGRVLAEPVFADREHPPFHRVAMDGVAIAYRSSFQNESFRITGRLAPGIPNPEGNPPKGDPIEVMTGAALPLGWDTVIPWEHLESSDSIYRLSIGKKFMLGMNVHQRGSDYALGELLIRPGGHLSSPHLHILASVGCERIQVVSQPRISLIATGDELVPVSATPEPYQIRRSNMVVLAGALIRAGLSIHSNQHLRDDPESLLAGFKQALAESDVLIVSGAVSMGSKDYVPRVLESLGCTCLFHHVAQKPGKPFWFGKSPQGGVIFALPGNPVASLLCFRRYILDQLCHFGSLEPFVAITLPLAKSVLPDPHVTRFLPALLAMNEVGKTVVDVRPGGGSGNFAAVLPSHGFVELPASSEPTPAGAHVSYYPWEAV